jgi:acyl-CoA synthetase (AMP-forming)/AMP-acid ligase II
MSHTKFVHDFLTDAAAAFPRKPALYAQGAWSTFGELDRRSDELARFLLDLGLRKGDRVALLLENSAEYVITYYAILKAGGTTVALNTENTRDDVSFVVGDCGVRFLVTNRRLAPKVLTPAADTAAALERPFVPGLERTLVWSDRFEAGPEGSPPAIVWLPEALEEGARISPAVRLVDLDVASIVYTSGSTGKPRGAVLSHLNIVSNTRSIVEYLRLTADDRVLAVLPFYYIYGKSLLNTHVFVGGSVVIDNRFLYPNVILQTMQDQEVTGFAGVPSTFTILLNRSNLRDRKFPKLRYVTQAGGAMAPSVQKDVAEAFSPARLYVMYGATEASARLSYLDPDDLSRKWGSIGKPIPNVEMFVADENGRPLGPGRQGEIVARGSNIMSGYWGHPEETQKVLRNGLYFTGDIGVTDEEGFTFVVGRTKDMIKIGGNRVSAKEIEEAIQEHPAVVEVAVIGIADDVLGEAPRAFIVAQEGSQARVQAEMVDFLKDRLAFFKIPKSFEFRDALPKNESGKIQKLKLA